MDALTGRAAFPLMASALAIAWQERSAGANAATVPHCRLGPRLLVLPQTDGALVAMIVRHAPLASRRSERPAR